MMSKTIKTVLSLSFVMILIKIFDILVSPNHFFEGRIAYFSWIELLLVLVLGLIAGKLSVNTNIPNMWDDRIENRKRFLEPLFIGILIGIIFVVFDSFLKIGDISVGWPLSPIFYIWGAISQELLFHFFPMVVLIWFFVNKLFKGKYYNQIYWSAAAILSLTSAISMFLSFGNPMISLVAKYIFVPFLIGIIVFITEMILFGMMKKYGFISSLFARLGFYSIWHVIWPVIFY